MCIARGRSNTKKTTRSGVTGKMSAVCVRGRVGPDTRTTTTRTSDRVDRTFCSHGPYVYGQRILKRSSHRCSTSRPLFPRSPAASTFSLHPGRLESSSRTQTACQMESVCDWRSALSSTISLPDRRRRRRTDTRTRRRRRHQVRRRPHPSHHRSSQMHFSSWPRYRVLSHLSQAHQHDRFHHLIIKATLLRHIKFIHLINPSQTTLLHLSDTPLRSTVLTRVHEHARSTQSVQIPGRPMHPRHCDARDISTRGARSAWIRCLSDRASLDILAPHPNPLLIGRECLAALHPGEGG